MWPGVRRAYAWLGVLAALDVFECHFLRELDAVAINKVYAPENRSTHLHRKRSTHLKQVYAPANRSTHLHRKRSTHLKQVYAPANRSTHLIRKRSTHLKTELQW